MKPSILCGVVVILVAGGLSAQEEVAAASRPAGRPNVVVIVSDDAGYADFSCHGSEVFRTPRIDSIGQKGVRFIQGYVTASVCSPSRAGLMTGRYQQRFGHEFNIPPVYSEVNGLPVEERTLAQVMKGLGYRTIALGKWHLGYADHFHPLSRGFDDYFGFLQGARSYWPIEGTRLNRLLRNRQPVVPESFDYMTDELGRQAAAYIERFRDRPFLMYLSFNAVHTPMHALPSDLESIEGLSKKKRRKLAAMTVALDRAVGMVLDALAAHEIERNTLVFFVNDNGGATINASSNAPLRGHKGTPYEGGIRVPFMMKWPAKLPAGVVYEHPVSTLDILPTAVAAGGGQPDPEVSLDGVDLIPFLLDPDQENVPHSWLCWRQGKSWAVRDGDMKLLFHAGKDESLATPEPALFNLATDPGETRNLANDTIRVHILRTLYNGWEGQLAQPRWGRGASKKRPGGK